MSFKSDHYVPVLKLKDGEKKALTALRSDVCPRVTPLLEVVERTDKKVDAHLETAFKGLHISVANFDRYMLDARELQPDGAAAAEAVFDRAASVGVAFTPVTGITRTVDVAAALKHSSNGVAIRLSRDELESGHVPKQLPAFMTKHGLAPDAVDLIVDLGPVHDMVSPGIQAMTTAVLADVPQPTAWRTLTVSGSAFPLSMGGVDTSSFDLADRAEWQAWRDGLHAQRTSLVRLPSFSDAAIQHPRGVERFDFRRMQVSASVRYTLPDQWLLIKGVSTRSVPPGQQFPELAKQLVYGHLQQHYAGEEHCNGCRAMKRAADGAPRLGSATKWRLLGTIHHITVAVERLAALAWP